MKPFIIAGASGLALSPPRKIMFYGLSPEFDTTALQGIFFSTFTQGWAKAQGCATSLMQTVLILLNVIKGSEGWNCVKASEALPNPNNKSGRLAPERSQGF